MLDAELQADINASYDLAAATYESEVGHGIANDDSGLWLDLVRSAASPAAGARALDVGAGTGALTRLVARAGFVATGLEPSTGMLDEARKAVAVQFDADAIAFVLGDAHDEELFAPATFDLIVSRQAVCYLADPLRAFANWRRWLKPKGRVLVIDGLWGRGGWADDGVVDRLPLSCLQTRATLPYLLERSGFRVLRNEWLTAINDRLRAVAPKAAQRYAIIAEAAER